ncbi:CD109 antigen [Merluccius polli]|uniref:CD109 antigen n=1 Tax=Merluccius polli TaxID=89951 RepID=A0AA47NXV4_MERPO|nr:CD109 antigen [Merluccius polli]
MFVCFRTCFGSTVIQKPLYLLSGPNVLYGARATNLAVTILTESPVNVTTHLTQGNANLSSTTVTVPGGWWQSFSFHRVDGGSLSPSAPVKLTVSGYQGGQLIFSNSTTLNVSLGDVSTSVQTDRARYRPGQTVRIRIASLHLDNRPYKGAVEISVSDPGGNVIQRWDSQESHVGIVSKDFLLSQSSALGEWTVVTTTNVNPPRFDLLLTTAPEVLVGQDISGTVRARFPLRNLYERGDGDIPLNITASVTETSTGFKVETVFSVDTMQNIFKLQFRDFPQVLKPSLSFSAKLEIDTYNRIPLSPPMLLNSVSVVVTQKTSSAGDQTETTALPVVGGGYVLIQLTLHAQVQELIIDATFMTSKETLKLFTKFPSASDSYVQILPFSSLPAQVSARGQVFTAGTVVASSSVSLTPMMSWFPEVCVTIYCVLPDGEVISDTALVPIQQPNHVSLKWTKDWLKPGDQVSLLVTVQDPRSQVLILVTAGAKEAQLPLVDELFNRETECDTALLSDGLLGAGAAGQVDMARENSFQRGEQGNQWTDQGSPMTWLYLDANVSGTNWVSPSFTVPNSINSWRVEALVMSDDLGLGFSQSLAATQQRVSIQTFVFVFCNDNLRVSLGDLTISMDVPGSLIRGEEIVLEMKVFNHLQWDREVIMLVEHSEAFEFVLSVDERVSVVNARKVTVGSQSSVSVLFPIRPLALGEMEISSILLSAETSESLVQTVLVKPEGVARTFSQTLFLELAPDKNKDSKTTSFSFPPDVVPGSQRVHVAVVGDILALSIGSLESLVDLPQSCGEQNMVPFVPSIAVLQYLDPLDNAEIRARALAILAEGYRKELSYQRGDGSFSAFGNRDSSGSTWLTAFVLRSFLQAQPYMLVDQSVVSRAAGWLVTNQGPGGDFAEAGRVIHTEMRRCRDDCPAALTAFVVMALLEDKTYAVKYESTVSQAVAYLERTVLATTGNYTLCVMMYALTLANRPAANDVLEELRRRTDVTDEFRWRSADALQAEGEWRARSAEVEMVSYVLMALFRRGAVTEGFPLMKWLSKQRSSLGGYGSTQDTAVAIQAIALYASISGAFAIDLNIQMSFSSMSGVSDFNINSSNYLLYQSKEIDVEQDVSIDLQMEGRGFALFQMNLFYNVWSAWPPVEAFSLIVEVQDDKGDPDHMLLSICTGLLGIDGVSQTGMVIVDVGLLSGFIIVPEAASPVDPIRQVETPPGRVILYLDSLTLAEVCIRLPLVRRHKVALMQNATVHVYDYYEPGRGAKRMYNSELMQVMDSCSFCGQDCSHCRSGVSLVKSSSTSWHAVSIATCSLGTLFAVMTLSFA